MPWATGSWANSNIANGNVAQGHAYFAGLRQTAAQPCATRIATRTVRRAMSGAGFVPGTVQGAIGFAGLVPGIVQNQVEVAETMTHATVEETEAHEGRRTRCDFWERRKALRWWSGDIHDAARLCHIFRQPLHFTRRKQREKQ